MNTEFADRSSFGHTSPAELATALREHADRTAGGGPATRTYDPETLCLEHDAARTIEGLLAELDQVRRDLAQELDSHMETAAIMRRARERAALAELQLSRLRTIWNDGSLEAQHGLACDGVALSGAVFPEKCNCGLTALQRILA